MSSNNKLDGEKILLKKFKGKNGGYDALEVDEFFDLVIADYKEFETLKKELIQEKAKNEKQNAKVVDLEAKLIVLSRKNTQLEKQLAKGGPTIEDLKKIDRYERKLWELGIDPSKIK